MNLTPKQLVGRHVLTHDGELATVASVLTGWTEAVVKTPHGVSRVVRVADLRLIPVLEFRLCGEHPPGTPGWYAERGVQRRKVTIVARAERSRVTGEPTTVWYATAEGDPLTWWGANLSDALVALRRNDPYFRDLDVIEYTLDDGSKHTWRNS